jgi:serine/threonine protein kinase
MRSHSEDQQMTANSAAATESHPSISHYQVNRLLGEGGAARTWLATDSRDGTPFAIKELQLLSAGGGKHVELFERECSTLRDLRHPQIPRFIETIVDRRAETMSLYLVQEHIDGLSLQQILDAGIDLDPQDTVAVMRSSLAPLSYLHERQPPLYHRDIKPSNVLVRRDGTCVLVDFGAVREALADPRAGGSSVVGTFGYMAPEQFQARAYAATDLYALGAMAIHLLTGREPSKFEIRRLKPDFHAHLKTDPHLAAILDLLLEPAAEDRYRDAHALRRALDRWSSRFGGTASTEERLRRLLDRAEAVRKANNTVETPSDDVEFGGGSLSQTDRIERTAEPDAGTTAPMALDASDLTEIVEPEFVESIAQPAPTGPPAIPSYPAITPPPAPTEEPTPLVNVLPEPEPSSEADTVPNGAIDSGDADDILEAFVSGNHATIDSGVRHSPSGLNRRPISNQSENANPLEVFAPGGQGAPWMGVVLLLVAIGLAGYGFLGQLEYNADAWKAGGAILGLWALLLAVVPRRSVSTTDGSLKAQGVNTTGAIERLIRRSSWLGATEFVVEYDYVADDGLHYSGKMRLPSAKAAKMVSLSNGEVQVRYLPYRPDHSQLLFRK